MIQRHPHMPLLSSSRRSSTAQPKERTPPATTFRIMVTWPRRCVDWPSAVFLMEQDGQVSEHSQTPVLPCLHRIVPWQLDDEIYSQQTLGDYTYVLVYISSTEIDFCTPFDAQQLRLANIRELAHCFGVIGLFFEKPSPCTLLSC